MRGWKDGYLTKAALLSQIKRVVCKDHNLKRDELLVNMLHPWREITFPTGYVAKSTRVRLRASGFNTRDYIVTQEKHHKWTMY